MNCSDGVREGTGGEEEDAAPTITPSTIDADYHPFEVTASGDPRPLHAPHIKDRLPEIPVTMPKQNPVMPHLQLSCFHGGGKSAGPRSGAKTPTGSGIGAGSNLVLRAVVTCGIWVRWDHGGFGCRIRRRKRRMGVRRGMVEIERGSRRRKRRERRSLG